MHNPLAGGAEIYFQEIFRRLVERGHEVAQLAERFPGSDETETIDGIKVRRPTHRRIAGARARSAGR